MFANNYGISPQLCFISIIKDIHTDNFFVVRFIFYFSPIWIILLANFFFYFRSVSYLRRENYNANNINNLKNLWLFPVALLVSWTLMTIFRIIDCFVDYDNEIFIIFAVFLSTLNGCFNSILFVLHPKVSNIFSSKCDEEIIDKRFSSLESLGLNRNLTRTDSYENESYY